MNEEFDKIEEAMAAVRPQYTQKSITIENGELFGTVSVMRWEGIPLNVDCPEISDVAADFGEFGFYRGWVLE